MHRIALILTSVAIVTLANSCTTTPKTPSLKAYADTLVIGKTTRAQMEADLGEPEKEQPNGTGTALTWIQRKTETRIALNGRPADVLAGDTRGYQHTVVRPTTLSATFNADNILKAKQVLTP